MWAHFSPAETHIRFSFLYWVKAPAGMDLMEFCSRRLGNRAENSQLTIHPATSGCWGPRGQDGPGHHVAHILGQGGQANTVQRSEAQVLVHGAAGPGSDSSGES